MSTSIRSMLCVSLLVVLSACRQEAQVPVAAPATPEAAEPVPEQVVGPLDTEEPAVPSELEDVMESGPGFVIGISYPPEANRYPGLVAELYGYARSARADLMDAVTAGELQPGATYDLSLSFSTLLDTPDMLAIAADGSSYTGGAHESPLIARFVWLVDRQTLLKAEDLFADPEGWQVVSDYVREQLHAALSLRVDADEMEPVERNRLMQSGARMIDAGSGPDPANFQQFEPVVDEGGRLSGLRFVFPPYQVGPYSDGTQSVEVPAAVLLPHLSPGLQGLFTAG